MHLHPLIINFKGFFFLGVCHHVDKRTCSCYSYYCFWKCNNIRRYACMHIVFSKCVAHALLLYPVRFSLYDTNVFQLFWFCACKRSPYLRLWTKIFEETYFTCAYNLKKIMKITYSLSTKRFQRASKHVSNACFTLCNSSDFGYSVLETFFFFLGRRIRKKLQKWRNCRILMFRFRKSLEMQQFCCFLKFFAWKRAHLGAQNLKKASKVTESSHYTIVHHNNWKTEF